MNNSEKKASILQVVISVLAAMFGVQSSKARLRDFSQSSPWVYIFIGIIMTAVFVGCVLLVVNLVLANT